MSETIDAGAPAPSESTSAPIDTNTAPETTPLGNQAPVAEKPEASEKPAPSKSSREALEKAFAAQEAKAKETAPKLADAAPKPSDGPARSEDGKFAAREGAKPADTAEKPAEQPKPTQRYEAPARFSPEAKAAWDTAPDSVKAETQRALTELQQGYEKHKEAAQNYEPIRHYDKMARESGTTLTEALDRYTSAENMLRQDPIRGLDHLCQQMGMSLRQVAAHVLGQPQDQQASQNDQTVRELRQELATLKQQIGGVTGHLQTQQTNATVSQIEAFAAENPDFDTLADDIAFFLQTGRAQNLQEAHSLARRLNQTQQPMTAPPPAASIPPPLNPAGTRTVTGAPSNGSDPSPRAQASATSRQALERAFATVGLRS